MRKKEENKKKWMVIVVAGLIVFSMVISIFAVVVDNQSSTIPDYNKHKFVGTDTGYKTKIDGKYVDFYSYPSELERIPLSPDIKSKLKNSQGIGIIFDPFENITDNLQYIDLIRYELPLQMDKPIYFGTTKNSTGYNLPIAGCDSATPAYPLILINISSDTSFEISDVNPDCIIMNARLREILAAKDRLLYSYYDVMN